MLVKASGRRRLRRSTRSADVAVSDGADKLQFWGEAQFRGQLPHNRQHSRPHCAGARCERTAQLEDRRADRRMVPSMCSTISVSRRAVYRTGASRQGLGSQPGREQALDDVVVQVAGDPVAVLEECHALLVEPGVGKFKREPRRGWRRWSPISTFVVSERLTPPQPGHYERTASLL
jgi:hypothetical protein